MSILDEIEARVQEGRLVRQDPLIGGRHGRVLYLENDLHREVRRCADATSGKAHRIGQLHRDFDRFSSGALIAVGSGDERSCFMKLLDPSGDQVWEIRSRDPKPALRVFGCFAFTDVFVATQMAWRSALGGSG